MSIPANTLSHPTGFGHDNSAIRLGVAVAASLGLNVLLVMGAGHLAESMEQRAMNGDERNAIIEMTTFARPTPTPIATPTPAAKATPIATPAPVATPQPIVTPRAIVTPRPIATPRATSTPRPTTQVASNRTVRRNTTSPTATASTRSNTTERTLPLLARGNTTVQPALRPSSSRISAADTAAGSRGATAPVAAPRAPQALAAGRLNNNPAPLVAATTTAAAITPNAASGRLKTTSGGVIGKTVGSNSVVTMNAKAASASVSANDFYLPSGGTVRAGTPTARQGRTGGSEIANIAGDPTIISATEEAQVLAAPGANRRLVGVGSAAAIRGPIGATAGALAPRTGGGGSIQAGIGDAGGAAGSAGAGAAGGGARGVAVRNGGAAGGRDGTLSAVGGGGAGVETGGVGVGNGSGRGTALAGNGSGGGGNARIRGTGGPAGGSAGGTRTGTGTGVLGVPNGVPGGTVAVGGTTVRKASGGAANGKTGDGPKAAESENTAKAATTVEPEKPKDAKKVVVKEDESDVSLGANATQVGARAVSKGSLENFITDEMRRKKIDGSVRFRVTVEASGRASFEMLDGSGDSEVDRAVTAYIKGWRWEPAKQDGKPIQSTLTQRIRLSQN